MSGLRDIGVKVETADMAADPVIGNALPILNEIATLLERLVDAGESASIDLRAMPLAPGDYEMIEQVLGRGEIDATLDALGRTSIRETAVRGVWWVRHFNAHDEIMAEFIEVTRVPELLVSMPEDVADSLTDLRNRLAVHYRQEGD